MREIRICIVFISIPRFFFATELTVFWLERLHGLSLRQLCKVNLSSAQKFSLGIPECRHSAPCREQCSTTDSWQRFRASVWWGGVDEPNLKDILHISNHQVFPNYTPRPSKGKEEISSVNVPSCSSWSLNYYYIYSFDLLYLHKHPGDGCLMWREARGRLDNVRSPFPSLAGTELSPKTWLQGPVPAEPPQQSKSFL